MRCLLLGIGFLWSACGLAAEVSPTLAPFTSDGCSRFPDGTARQPTLWCGCCVIHDVAYWQGGSEAQRQAADQALEACIQQVTDSSVLGHLMYWGVRIGGSPAYATAFRWGYGWSPKRDYGELTAAEQQQVAARLLEHSVAEEQARVCPEQNSTGQIRDEHGNVAPTP